MGFFFSGRLWKIIMLPAIFYQDYQFWNRADEGGYFSINNVRTGDYNLYAWVPGVIGDYRYDVSITITPGITPLI